jgi:hypothetical protein
MFVISYIVPPKKYRALSSNEISCTRSQMWIRDELIQRERETSSDENTRRVPVGVGERQVLIYKSWRKGLLRVCSLPMQTQNIFSSIHHIESLNVCMKY